jgi:hypothetical protein
MYFRNLDGVELRGTMEVGGLVSLAADVDGSPRGRRIFESQEPKSQVPVVGCHLRSDAPVLLGEKLWSR